MHIMLIRMVVVGAVSLAVGACMNQSKSQAGADESGLSQAIELPAVIEYEILGRIYPPVENGYTDRSILSMDHGRHLTWAYRESFISTRPDKKVSVAAFHEGMEASIERLKRLASVPTARSTTEWGVRPITEEGRACFGGEPERTLRVNLDSNRAATLAMGTCGMSYAPHLVERLPSGKYVLNEDGFFVRSFLQLVESFDQLAGAR